MNIDRGKLMRDLRSCAEVAEVAYDADFVRRSVEAFDDVLDGAWMSMRTTTHPKVSRRLNWRLGYRGAVSPLDRAREAGLRTGEVHPMEHLFKELEGRFPLHWGVDFDVDGVLDKIWAGFHGDVSIDDLLCVPGFPANIAAAKRAMDRVSVVGFHLGKAYVNVYAEVFPQGALTPRRMHDLVADLGFAPPTEAELAVCPKAFTVYESYPYGHSSASPSRISFSTLCAPDEVPAQLHPLLGKFVEKAPIAADKRRFFFYTDYSAKEKNFKISTDYLGGRWASELIGQ